MFLSKRKLSTAAVSLALGLAGAGCGGSTPDDPDPSPTWTGHQSLDPQRFGDRSGNPSCETAVNAVSDLAWTQVQMTEFTQRKFLHDVSFNSVEGALLGALYALVNLDGARVTLEAHRAVDGDHWSVIANGGTHEPVQERVVHALVYDSCRRTVWSLDRSLTVNDVPMPGEAVTLHAGRRLAVSDAYHAPHGALHWTVEDDREQVTWRNGGPLLPRQFTVRAEALTAAATRE